MGKLRKFYDAIGGRKAVFLLLLIIIAVVTTLFVKVDLYTEMMKYLSIMYGAFCVGNAAGKIGSNNEN